MHCLSKGSFKKYATRLGLEGLAKKMTWGGGDQSQRVISLFQKNIISKIVFD